MKNLIKGLTIISFIALTACQKGFDAAKAGSVTVLNSAAEVTPEFQQAVVETQENVTKMEVNVEQSLQQMDALFASVQSTILSSTASQSGGGVDFGNILGTIGSIILGGFNPISLIMSGINLVTGLVDGFNNGSGINFNDFQSTFNALFGNIQGIVTQAKSIVSEQRQLVLSQLALLDPNNPAHAHGYQQLMNIMHQLDMADQKIITKVADFNSRAQAFMNQISGLQNNNSGNGIGSLAGSFLQNFQGIIKTAISVLLGIL